MTFFKFERQDIFHNRIKTHPDVNFIISNQRVYYNNETHVSGNYTDNVRHIPVGHISLYELNVDRPAGGLAYPFITKDGNLIAFKTITTSDFNEFQYGDTITGSYPLKATISSDRYTTGQDRPHIDALRNTLNFYQLRSPHFAFNSSLGNKETQELRLISFPSIFYGSKIQKGTVSLKTYISGVLHAELVDDKLNGELRQKLPADSNSGSIAGVVLYNEGFFVLTGSWDVLTHVEEYVPSFPAAFRWIDFGTTGTAAANVPSSTFGINMKGEQSVPVVTMFAHAPRGELNYSNNPTFIKFGQDVAPSSGSTQFSENQNLEIKNIVKSNFIEPTASFAKTTYITRIGLYDKDMNLIGFAKTARPIRKREKDEFTFKLKLDF